MDDTSVKRTVDEKKSEEDQSNLLKLFEKMQAKLLRAENSVQLSKDALTECHDKLAELGYQIDGLKSVMEEAVSNVKQQQSLEQIAEEKEKDIRDTSDTTNYEKQRKKQKTNPENCDLLSTTNYDCEPGPSQEIPNITRNNYSEGEKSSNEKEAADPTERYCTDVAKMRNDKELLSEEEFKTFLYLSDQGEDPVTFALSFTNNIERLYLQLLNFYFYLKEENDTVQNESGGASSKRDLEVKVQRLIEAFQRQITPEMTKNSCSQEEHSTNKAEVVDITKTDDTEDVVDIAIRKSKDGLSQEEFKTFLCLLADVDDPVQYVQLANTFTKDLDSFYLQLMTFHFQLKVANDAAEKERGTCSSNRDLEDKVQRIILAFQAAVGNSNLPSTSAVHPLQIPFLQSRRHMATLQHMRGFFNRH